jgi:6-phosphogluconolactonase/glucosamine-6-phosphate isomerase/deaminase
VLDVTDRTVAPTAPYLGRRRMTLTYRALANARQILWLVSGEESRRALALLLDGDTTITAGRVSSAHSLVMADRAALGS